MLRAVRLDEVLPALDAQLMFGSNVALDQVGKSSCGQTGAAAELVCGCL
jgi:hypothetical protein